MLKNLVDVSSESLRDFIMRWDTMFPLDYWWRQRHGIRFGSKDHLDANFIDMCIDFIEHKEITNRVRQNGGAGIKSEKDMSDADFAEFMYENVDLTKFDDKITNKDDE